MEEKYNPYKAAMESIATLKDLEFAHSRIAFWTERAELAATKIDAWTAEEKRLTAKNQGKPFEAVPYARSY